MKTILLIFLLPIFLYSNVARVTGKITLEDNNPASNVKIELISSIDENEKIEFSSDENGNFDFEVNYGIYNISFSKELYQTVTLNEEWINSDKNYQFELLRDKYFGILPKGIYTFDRNIVVPDGDTLTIQEGTEIHLTGSSSLIVEGFLIAEGTYENPIKIYRDFWENKTGIIEKFIKNANYEDSIIDKVKFKNVVFEKVSICQDTKFDNFHNINFSNCTFLNNSNIFIHSANLYISNCVFKDNIINDFLIYVYMLTNLEIVNSKFYNNKVIDNVTNSSIIGSFDSDINLINCVFEDNEAGSYTLFESYYNFTNISNCLFKNNKTGKFNTLFHGKVNCYNSIFWENEGDDFNKTVGLENNKIYNCLFYKSENLRVDSEIKYFGVNFTTNENGDSVDVFGNLFQDPDIGIIKTDDKYDISINENSVCIDAGKKNEIVDKIQFDINGNERNVDGNLKGTSIIDIGPVEFQTNSSSVEKSNYSFKIYPNPASESITISGIGQGKVEIYNTLGQKLIEKEIFGTSTINTSTLQTGMYVIKLESGGEVVFEKVIVNK